jgi:hypothetical protein
VATGAGFDRVQHGEAHAPRERQVGPAPAPPDSLW